MDLLKLIPPNVRRWVYAIYGLVGLILGAISAAYGALGDSAPDWLRIVLAVYAFVGTAIGATAGSNVSQPSDGDGGTPPARRC